MKQDLIEKIKQFHLKVCLAVLMLFSLFFFVSGFTFDNLIVAWWICMIYGWSGLVVGIEYYKYLYKGK